VPRNPHAAVLVKKRRRKPGNLQELLRTIWTAILEAEAVLLAASSRQDEEVTLKAVHAVVQAGACYAKLLEAGEIEARLAALEAALAARKPTNGQVITVGAS
jgi:hypothetical protein